MPEFDIDITPDKSLIQKLGLVGYKTEQAIAELVDNAIDARLPDVRQNIKITLGFEDGQISVSDDGSGMDKREVADAMTIARSSKDEGRLGRFGIGMKSACSALGEKFTITTSKTGSNMEYIVEYDENSWLNDDGLGWSNVAVRKRMLDDTENWHGTTITVSEPRVPLYANQVTKFKENFCIRYGPLLESGQVGIQINTVSCKPGLPDIVPSSRSEFSIDVSGGRITGYIALLKKRSIRGHYGIHLFKNGRLIRAFEKFGFVAHPENARIIGEAHMNHVPVNFAKNAFLRESRQYLEAEESFKTCVELKDAIQSSRSKENSIMAISSLVGYFAGKSESGYLPPRMRAGSARDLLDDAGVHELEIDGKHVLLGFADTGHDSPYSVSLDRNQITVTINTDSPALRYVANPLYLVGMALSEAKAALASRNVGSFISKRDQILSEFLADWSIKPGTTSSRSRKAVPASRAGYGLSRHLMDIHADLEENFRFKFQFTALSTLHDFLHNAVGADFYTMHTKPGSGQDLAEIISERSRGSITALHLPSPATINALFNAGHKRLVLIREYAEIPGSTIAPPEKAWVDLAVEILTHGVPVDSHELVRILDSMSASFPVDRDKIRRYAKHLKRLDQFQEYMVSEWA